MRDDDRQRIWTSLSDLEERTARGGDGWGPRLYDSLGFALLVAAPLPLRPLLMMSSRRVDRVREAMSRSATLTRQLLLVRFSGIELAAVLTTLESVVEEIALCYGAGIVGGAAVGGGLGAMAGGAGALPGAIGGAVVGAEAATLTLGILGLKDMVTGMFTSFRDIEQCYTRGMREAWGPLPGQGFGFDPFNDGYQGRGDVDAAAWYFAQGNELLTLALLAALLAYLTRRGGALDQAWANIRTNPRLGGKFADWLMLNESKLRQHPALGPRSNGISASQRPAAAESRGNAVQRAEASSATAPSRRRATPGDMHFQSADDALAEALSRYGIDPATVETTQMYGKNPNLLGPQGQPWERVIGLTSDGDVIVIDHHASGHYFSDTNEFELPHYHGPNGEHLTYPGGPYMGAE